MLGDPESKPFFLQLDSVHHIDTFIISALLYDLWSVWCIYMSGMTFSSATQEMSGVNLHPRPDCCSSYPKMFFSSPSLNKGGVSEEGTVKECISTTDVKNSPSVSRCYPSTMHLHRNKGRDNFSLPGKKKGKSTLTPVANVTHPTQSHGAPRYSC